MRAQHSGKRRKAHIPRVVLAAYLVQLLVPLFLFSDAIAGWHFGWRGISGITVLLTSTLWLVFGVGAIVISRDRVLFLQRLAKPLVAAYACFLSFIVLELFMQFAIGHRQVTLYEPGMRTVLHPSPSVTPGIQGPSVFSVNEVGLRGPSLPGRSDVYKIVAVGGSTTVCVYLDDSETWPSLLMRKLNSSQTKAFTWIGNAGVSGHTTVHHLSLLRNLPILGEVDMLIFLIGANDLQRTLALHGAPSQRRLEDEASTMVEQILQIGSLPYHDQMGHYPFYQRFELFQLTRRAWLFLRLRWAPSGIVRQIDAEQLVESRAQRAAGPVVPLPDLRTGLKEFEDRTIEIARECRTHSMRCLFLTQPSMWRDGLMPTEQRLLWIGFVGTIENPTGYIEAAEAAEAADMYNRTLLGICQREKLECYDLAAVVAKDTSSFYDDLHFNEGGAEVVAQHLAEYLLSTPPFHSEPAQLSVPKP